MRDKIRLISNLILLLLGIPHISAADTIYLTSGQRIEGTIVERTDDEIKVDTGIGVLVTYYLDEIKEIPSEAPGVPEEPKTTVNGLQNILPMEENTAPHPSADIDPSTREEHFLLQQYQRAQNGDVDASANPPKPLSNEEYLEKQLKEKQAILKEEIARGVRLADEKLTQGIKTLIQDKPQLKETLKTRPLPPYYPAILIALLAGCYAVIFCPWMMIANKMGLAGWIAWVPIVQIFLLPRMASRPLWWVLLLLIPFINILVSIVLWMDIAKRFNKSAFLGVLMIVPILNLVIPWYLAFSTIAED